MRVNLQSQAPWAQLLIFGGITMLLFALLGAIGLALVASINHLNMIDLASLKPEDYALPKYAAIAKEMLVVQFFSFFLFPSLLFAWLSNPDPFQYAGLKRPDRSSFIYYGILIILCAYVSVSWLGYLNQQLVSALAGKSARAWIEKGESDVDGTLQNILNMKNAGDLLVSVLLVGVLAAVGEEIFFRGILQRIFIQLFRNPWWGIIVTAAIFSAAHGQFLGFLPRMILGIVLGALYWYSGSLFPAIAGHFFFNTVQVVLVYYKVMTVEDSTSQGGLLMSFIGIVALAAVVGLLIKIRKISITSYQSVYQNQEDQIFPDYQEGDQSQNI